MQQVLVIHGGTSFETYEDYISFLQTRELNRERLTTSFDWRSWLAEDLGTNFEVLSPKMPNGTNARYEEWQLWFERCISLLTAEVVLVGQSLGGIFLVKYLSENDFPQKIKATFLVAAPFDQVLTVESLKDFALPDSLEKFSVQGGEIYLCYSQDDPVVPFTELAKYKQHLPQAQAITFQHKGHFDQRRFPELVELIQKI